MAWTDLLRYTVTLIAITNPFGNLAIFIGLTANKSPSERKRIAVQGTIATFIIMLIVTWAGPSLLGLFGISIPAFQLAGGLVITLLGLQMLSSHKSEFSHTPEEQDEAAQRDNIAVVPLAIPLLAGPGAITAIIVGLSEHQNVIAHFQASIATVVVVAIIFIALFFATPIGKLLGTSGIKIAIRVMGLVLIAMAMEMIISGLNLAFPIFTGG